MQRVPLHVPLHHPPGQGHLLADREHECLAIARRAAGRPPNTAHVLARITGVVEEHHMVHVGKVDASRRPAKCQPSNATSALKPCMAANKKLKQKMQFRPICAHKEHGVRRLFFQELFDVCDALGLIQRSMEWKNLDLRSFPIKPPQHILNLSACINLAIEKHNNDVVINHTMIDPSINILGTGPTLLQKIIVLRTGDSSTIFTSADFLLEKAVSGFFSSLSSPLQSTRICS